jgi:hypothetical protein
MLRRIIPFALVLSAASIAAPAGHTSASMCVGHTRCGVTRVHVHPASAQSRQRMVVVPMRSDGSQHGGISWYR